MYTSHEATWDFGVSVASKATANYFGADCLLGKVSKRIIRTLDEVRDTACWDQARICKRLRSPGIDSKESILQTYVAWRAGTSNRVVVPACQATSESKPGLLKGLQIRALVNILKNI